MKFFHAVVAVVVVLLGSHVAAVAGPGDPRLVNGVLEWPRTVSNEPFVVVRGDDGVLYYVGMATARRDAALAAGGRVAVLGLEGRSAHEITALGIGAGESIEAALANLQGARPSVSTVAAPPAAIAPVAPAPTVAAPAPAPGLPIPAPAAVAAPSTSAPATVAAPAAPAAVAVTPPAPAAPPTPPANGGAAAIAPPSPNAGSAPAAAAPSAKSVAPSPAPSVSAPSVNAPTPAVTPPAGGVITQPNVISVPVPPSSRATSAAPAPTSPPPPPPAKRPAIEVIATPSPAAVPASTSDDRRWTEVTGVVESIVGRTLVLRSPEGRVAVDVSSLSHNLDRMITPGATVRVYGVPVEMRFKALGFFDPGPPR